MRHLYAAEPKNETVIEHAKHFEKRRCNHHNLEQPLSAFECIMSVVDPKGSRTNKNRYVVASQDIELQDHLKTIPGVPLVYLLRSVMIMKPMSNATAQLRIREEQAKFGSGIKGSRTPGMALKRKRSIEDVGDKAVPVTTDGVAATSEPEVVKKKRNRGPKAPNSLSVKKAKRTPSASDTITGQTPAGHKQITVSDATPISSTRRKRR